MTNSTPAIRFSESDNSRERIVQYEVSRKSFGWKQAGWMRKADNGKWEFKPMSEPFPKPDREGVPTEADILQAWHDCRIDSRSALCELANAGFDVMLADARKDCERVGKDYFFSMIQAEIEALRSDALEKIGTTAALDTLIDVVLVEHSHLRCKFTRLSEDELQFAILS